jgi:phospholipase/carboxylesterase
MESINKLITVNNCILRYQHPVGSGPFPVFLLLHGWTGDENSMWIFAPQLPRDALLIAPRGFYQSSGSGYSWNPKQSPKWPDISDFFPAVELLFSMLSDHSFPEAKFAELHLIGFSQGAALAYSIVAIYPERVASIAGLSGFLPEGASESLLPGKHTGLPVFIAHGSQDTLVPVELAWMSVNLLQAAGATVVYCEDVVGHKLSAKCFHGLEAFYKNINC